MRPPRSHRRTTPAAALTDTHLGLEAGAQVLPSGMGKLLATTLWSACLLVGCADPIPAQLSNAMLGGDMVGAVAVAPETWTWLRRFTPAGSSAVFAGLTACPPSGAGANVVGAVIGSLAGPGGSEPVDVIVADLARFLDGIAAGRVLPCCGGFRSTRCTSIPGSPELFDPFGHRETTVACADDRGNELRFVVVDGRVTAVDPLALAKTAVAVYVSAPPGH